MLAVALRDVSPKEDQLMLVRALTGFAALICLAGCGRNTDLASLTGSPVAPSVDGSATTTAIGSTFRTAGSADVLVNMNDACDPDTFNAALGPGTCVRSGGVRFDDFIALLTRLGFVGPWQFAPNTVNARTGEAFMVINRGGEVHTFTEVEEFGGGIVPNLNELARVPSVAPECLALDAEDFVAPGQTYREDIEEEGNEKYQCCIHPWMRLEAHVSEGAHLH
jgi:hypothetical protein